MSVNMNKVVDNDVCTAYRKAERAASRDGHADTAYIYGLRAAASLILASEHDRIAKQLEDRLPIDIDREWLISAFRNSAAQLRAEA